MTIQLHITQTLPLQKKPFHLHNQQCPEPVILVVLRTLYISYTFLTLGIAGGAPPVNKHKYILKSNIMPYTM